MASGGHCGRGVMVWMQLHLVQCQASSASENTARKCQLMTKTLVWPDADRKDGSLNATHLWLLFLGVNMEIEIKVNGKTIKTSQSGLLALLKITAEIMDSGDVYPYFHGDHEKRDLEQARSLSIEIRELIDPLLV
jgi:hypothetical protein